MPLCYLSLTAEWASHIRTWDWGSLRVGVSWATQLPRQQAEWPMSQAQDASLFPAGLRPLSSGFSFGRGWAGWDPET